MSHIKIMIFHLCLVRRAMMPGLCQKYAILNLSQVGLAPSSRSSLHSLWTRGMSFSAKLYEIPGIPHRFPEISVINCPFCVKYVLFDKFSYFLIKIPDIVVIPGIPMGFLQAIFPSLLNREPFGGSESRISQKTIANPKSSGKISDPDHARG